jgi:guanylate kinase
MVVNGISLRSRGFMLILSSPSGGGKTTISRKILEADDRVKVSISMTTRSPRANEVDGKDYYFISEEEFRAKRHQNYFVEHAKVFDNYYGTPRDYVEKNLSAGYDMLFDIDWQGTIQLTQNARNDVVSIFILPPSIKALQSRLVQRNLDDDKVVEKRMYRAKNEINHWYGYDYVIINHSVEQCLADALHILKAERTRRTRQSNLPLFIENMFEEHDGSFGE